MVLSHNSGSCNSKIKVSAGWMPLEASLLLADDLPLAATSHGCLSEHVDLSCLCIRISSSYKGASQAAWVRVHLAGLILTSSLLEKSYLNIQSHFEVVRVRDLHINFGGHYSVYKMWLSLTVPKVHSNFFFSVKFLFHRHIASF